MIIDKITKIAFGMGQPLVLPAGRLEKSKCEKKTDKFYFYISWKAVHCHMIEIFRMMVIITFTCDKFNDIKSTMIMMVIIIVMMIYLR